MTKFSKLPPEWALWRSKRLRQMLAFGMSRKNAEVVSNAEARGRARIAKQVGYLAAASADLVVVPDGMGGDKFALRIDRRDLSLC